jgi:hypothetical protein
MPTKNSLNSSKESNIYQNTIKKVRFFNHVTIRESLHIKDYHDDEVKTSWYSKKEFRKMKEGVLLNAANSRSRIWKECISTYRQRETDFRYTEDTLRSKQIRQTAVVYVLREQEDQKIMGIYDPIAIAASYNPTSKVSAVIARNIGLQNELEVRDGRYHDNLEQLQERKKVKIFCPLLAN